MSLEKTRLQTNSSFCSNCVHSMMEMITVSLELWRSTDRPKARWSVLCTIPRGGRNQWTAHPRFYLHAILYFTLVVKNQKYHLCQFLLCSFSPLCLHFIDRSADVTPAVPAADKKKAAAARLSDPFSSSSPSQKQESKSQQSTQLWQPDRLRQR